MLTVRVRQALVVVAVSCAGCDRHATSESSTTVAKPTPEPRLTDRERFERKRICFELASRKEERDEKGAGAQVSVIPGTYCYSDQMNTCVYSGGFVGKGYASYILVDLLTNKDILTRYTNGKNFNRVPDDFQRRSDELFRTCTR